MTQLLSDIGSVFTAVITYVGDVAELYTTEPVLILTVAFVVVGFVIGIFGRLLARG